MSEDGKVAKHPIRPGVLSLTIRERSALYAAYMPFIKGGGLFIPTQRPYQMGDQVYLLLSILDDPTKLSLSCKVVWITPAEAQGNRQQGIGVQFDDSESGHAARNKIESILGNAIKSKRLTHTL